MSDRAKRRQAEKTLMAQRETIKNLRETNDQISELHRRARDERDRLERLVARLEHNAEDFAARQAVLLSDRDRLTAALEVQCRRHASPAAESDPTRAGWRHASRQHVVEYAQNPEEPKH